MNCNVIKDLLPLYIDECCSEESRKLISEHLENCPECKKSCAYMRKTCTSQPAPLPKADLKPISSWKASVLQSLALFIAFAVLAAGVLLEGNTPAGATNGLWAVAMIVPATGYLLSVSNWFFVRVYRSRKAFALCSGLVTLAITLAGYVWAYLHYTDGITLTSPLIWVGVGLSAIFCLLSGVLSNQYGKLLGRE